MDQHYWLWKSQHIAKTESGLSLRTGHQCSISALPYCMYAKKHMRIICLSCARCRGLSAQWARGDKWIHLFLMRYHCWHRRETKRDSYLWQQFLLITNNLVDKAMALLLFFVGVGTVWAQYCTEHSVEHIVRHILGAPFTDRMNLFANSLNTVLNACSLFWNVPVIDSLLIVGILPLNFP